MRVQLFIPPVWYYSGINYRMLPALGPPILSSVLRQAGHTCEAVDLEALCVTPDVLEIKFRGQEERWPDVVGFGVLDISAQGAKDSIAALRKAGYDRRIVVGGVHALLFPEKCLEWGADLVVTGECEGNIASLLESGVTGIHKGERCDIADVPIPDWDHVTPALTSYHGNLAMLRPLPGISMWTRGCPFSCIFCANPVYGGQPTRYRPAAHVIEEMRDLAERRVQRAYIYDDELVGTKLPDGWMAEIADGIEGLGIKWVCQGRCSQKYITPELMANMKRAGCMAVFWGVESFSRKVLKEVKKGITPEDIWHTLRVTKDAGIENAAFTMIGNYGETEDDLSLTAQALAEAYQEGLIQHRQTTVCTPMPGTELARRAMAEGWYQEPPDGGMQMLQPRNGTPWLSAERIEHWLGRFNQVCPVGITG